MDIVSIILYAVVAIGGYVLRQRQEPGDSPEMATIRERIAKRLKERAAQRVLAELHPDVTEAVKATKPDGQ